MESLDLLVEQPKLELPDKLTLQEWLDYGKKAAEMEQTINWFWGKWYAYGQSKGLIQERKKSELAEEIVRVSGKSMRFLQQAAEVHKLTIVRSSVEEDNFSKYHTVIKYSHSKDPANVDHYLDLADSDILQSHLEKQIKRDMEIEKANKYYEETGKPMAVGVPAFDSRTNELIERMQTIMGIDSVKEFNRIFGSKQKRNILVEISQLEERKVQYIKDRLSGRNKTDINII